MEIDITDFALCQEASDFSASQAELGKDAGQITWANAMREAKTYPWITADNRDEFERWVRGFGAWEEAEVKGWTLQHCCALAIQFVAGDLRELENVCDTCTSRDKYGFNWSRIKNRLDGGNSIYKGDDKRLYAYLGD